MTYFEKVVANEWKKRAAAHRLRPFICNRRDSRIKRDAHLLDEPRNRRREILVLANSEAETLHHDAAAEALPLIVERDDPGALGGRQQRFRGCVAAFVEAGADSRPIKSCNPAGDAGVHQILSCKHFEAAASSPATFHAAPATPCAIRCETGPRSA